MGMRVFQTEKEYGGLLLLLLVRCLIFFFPRDLTCTARQLSKICLIKFRRSTMTRRRKFDECVFKNRIWMCVCVDVSLSASLALPLLIVWFWAVCMCIHRQVDGQLNRQIDVLDNWGMILWWETWSPSICLFKRSNRSGSVCLFEQIVRGFDRSNLSIRTIKSFGARRFPPLAGCFWIVWSQ